MLPFAPVELVHAHATGILNGDDPTLVRVNPLKLIAGVFCRISISPAVPPVPAQLMAALSVRVSFEMAWVWVMALMFSIQPNRPLAPVPATKNVLVPKLILFAVPFPANCNVAPLVMMTLAVPTAPRDVVTEAVVMPALSVVVPV